MRQKERKSATKTLTNSTDSINQEIEKKIQEIFSKAWWWMEFEDVDYNCPNCHVRSVDARLMTYRTEDAEWIIRKHLPSLRELYEKKYSSFNPEDRDWFVSSAVDSIENILKNGRWLSCPVCGFNKFFVKK